MKNLLDSAIFRVLLVFLPFLILSIPGALGALPPDPADREEIATLLGETGQVQDQIFLLRFARNDIRVKIDGQPIPTALGIVSWTAWKRVGSQVMMIGDLVLLEQEVNPVIAALEQAHVEITSLDNRFLGANPCLMCLHISGTGKANELARGVRNALDRTGTLKPSPKQGEVGSAMSPSMDLDTKRIEKITGYHGQADGGVFRITVGRSGVKIFGIIINAAMGMNSWAGFIGTNDRAHVAGDLAITASEVNSTIRALTLGGIQIVSVHNHMLDEEPRIFFVHYWGSGPAENLAKTIRDVFDIVKERAK